jgi:hypothetical protein
MSRDDIKNLDFKALGASLYLCGDIGPPQSFCMAVISQNDYAYNDVIFISIEKNLAVDMKYAKTLLAIKLHATDDWNKELLGSRAISPEKNDFSFLSFVGDHWTIEEVIQREAPEDEQNKITINVIFDNKNQPVLSLSLEKYRQLFPDDYYAAIKDNNVRGEPAVNFAMARRAANFRAANIGKAAEIPVEILKRFNQVADAAVKHGDPSALGDALDPSLNSAFLGRFAAVLLKRDFQIVRYQANADDANSASIVAEYHPLETGTETRRATFQFRRPAAEAPWRLTGMDIATS